MRRWLVAPLLIAAAGLALDPPPAPGQAAVKPTEEAFTTADGVRLKGLFHKSPVANKQGESVVILLYPPGPDKTMLKGDWDGPIDKLNEAGFHVFRFDWRGHGQSTDITDPLGDMMSPFSGFWVNRVTGPLNQKYVRGYGKRPPKNDLRVKTDLINPGQYFPVYVNDLAAARYHLDTKNDQGELNTSSIYLIGAGDAATLGMMWLASEWARPGVAPTLGPPFFQPGTQYKVTPTQGVVADPPAGADIAGCIWLSANKPPTVPDAALMGWAKSSVKIRDQNKMLFLYGETDKNAAKEADLFFNKVLVAKGDTRLGLSPVEQTFMVPVAKTGLNGLALLGKDKDIKVETKCLEYLAARQKDRVNVTRKERKYVSPYYVDVSYYMNLR